MDQQTDGVEALADVVGDTRRVRLVSIDPSTGDDLSDVGEIWQDGEGVLHGSGMAAVMLYEQGAAARYQAAAASLDLSPLSVFYARLARTAFVRVEIINP